MVASWNRVRKNKALRSGESLLSCPISSRVGSPQPTITSPISAARLYAPNRYQPEQSMRTELTALAKGTAFTRAACALAVYPRASEAIAYAEMVYRDSPGTVRYLNAAQ